jgi:hypothetical protein
VSGQPLLLSRRPSRCRGAGPRSGQTVRGWRGLLARSMLAAMAVSGMVWVAPSDNPNFNPRYGLRPRG